ncbi:PP2C family serine/threonine-protein phosphatase [Paenibacillus sp. Marseille-Q4541]|uniref:PP2C family serine/threonine-protein phosphatase n=1 Tax=Paenibacillus sp. Marseille-Q4541 TaxID=2831522 RepID=UPI001BA868E4|nr:PP2C family serine/threonine-protein phosphatase [Paenibacillus sp. Marseille-Q4541]
MKSLRASVPDRGKSLSSEETFHYVSSQHTNQPLSTYKGQWFCRYGYGLSSESASYGDRGQDFAAIHIEGDVCTFVLCDGVSMSYHGDFAAKYLGEALFAWMNETKDWSSSLLYQFLMSLTIPASRELSNYEGSQNANMPILLREVLETKKKQGSQSMYICGKIKLAGKKRSTLQLAWQGDSRIRLFRNGTEIDLSFEKTRATAERWSTAEGPVGGSPHVCEQTFSSGEDLVLRLYTDGMGELDPIGIHLPDEEIQVLMDAPHTGGLEDDAAFIELNWKS